MWNTFAILAAQSYENLGDAPDWCFAHKVTYQQDFGASEQDSHDYELVGDHESDRQAVENSLPDYVSVGDASDEDYDDIAGDDNACSEEDYDDVE